MIKDKDVIIKEIKDYIAVKGDSYSDIALISFLLTTNYIKFTSASVHCKPTISLNSNSEQRLLEKKIN